MAYINLRVLLFLLGLIVVLNISQLALSTKRRPEIMHQPVMLAIKTDNQNRDKELLKTKSKPFPNPWTFASTTTSSSTVDNATCLNTGLTDDNDDDTGDSKEESMLCPRIPPDLGPESPSTAASEWYSNLVAGGYFKNQQCRAHENIAIIVPHSGPKKNLIKFLNYIHPFLMKQQAEYQIFVIDYVNRSSPLTHGYLFNVGFQEALKHRVWNCLIFHEHHLVPLDSRNLYRCTWYPKQLIAEIQMGQTIDDKVYQSTTVGGAIALTPEQFSQVNGFSNRVSGRDDIFAEFYKRLKLVNYTLETSDALIGQYKIIAGPFVDATTTKEYNSTSQSPLNHDGLNSLSYEVRHLVYQSLFTYIKVGKKENSREPPTGKLIDILTNSNYTY